MSEPDLRNTERHARYEAIIHDWTCGCGKGQACPDRDGCREAAEQIVATAQGAGDNRALRERLTRIERNGGAAWDGLRCAAEASAALTAKRGPSAGSWSPEQREALRVARALGGDAGEAER